MRVRRDAMVHVEVTSNGAVGGALCLTIEESGGQFGLPAIFEVGPFDTGLDVAVWLRDRMVNAEVLSAS